MKNFKNFALWFLFLIFLGLVGYYSVYNYMFSNSYDLINISYLSEDFMDDYFEEISNTNSSDKENMLIVISKKGISNDYGALNVIEAPNNQYVLQYSDSDSRDYAMKMLENDSSIESVEENSVYYTEETDVSYNSWGIKKMGLDNVIESDTIHNLSSVVVAIIDSGCSLDVFNKYYPGKLAGTYNVLKSSDSIMEDEEGHGTHVAGTIAEGTISNVKILPIKVSTDSHMYSSDIIAAINYIVYNKSADVINMSFGGYGYNEAMEQAIESAREANIISVAAAGNDNTDELNYPSALDNTISIGSVTAELTKSSFSNYGSTLSFVAPGSGINSIMSNDSSLASDDGDEDHEVLSGTSMATPHAVSAIAILKCFKKDLTFDKIMNILKDNAFDLGDTGWDKYYGYGLISFSNIDFCDGTNCDDEYGIYIDETKNYKSIEVTDIIFTNYNYYSLTNILGTNVKITYNDDSSEIVTLDELDNVTISNYDPYSSEEQEVVINVKSISTIMKITNPTDYKSGWLYNLLDDDTYEITGYNDSKLNLTKLYVPEKLPDSDGNYKNVSSFADINEGLAFNSEDFLSYIYLNLPDTINKIGDHTFEKSNIKYVDGSSNGIVIGDYGFASSSVVSVSVPIISIGNYAFNNCYELVFINVSGDYYGVSSSGSKLATIFIGDYAFYNCKKLVSVFGVVNDIISSDQTGDYAFYNCISLVGLDIVVTFEISDYAFYNTLSLYSISTSGVTNVGSYAFYGSNISSIKFSTAMDTISESSFENCKNLKEIEFYGKRIEKRAFWNSGIQEISISDTEFIADDAFAYSNLKGANATWNSDTSPYKVVNYLGIVENDNKLLIGFTNYKYPSVSNSKFTSGITEIGDYAFTGNQNLITFIVPDTVKKIGEYSFMDCYNLSYVVLDGQTIEFGDNTFKMSYQGEIIDDDLDIFVHKNSDIKQYVKNKNLKYKHIEADEIVVNGYKDSYNARDSINCDDLEVKLIYHEDTEREEVLPVYNPNRYRLPYSNIYGFAIIYDGGTAFSYDDTYFEVYAYNEIGYKTTKKIDVTVNKLIPTYTIPTDLTAEFGQKLFDIELPSGFEWMDDSIIINNVGNVSYKAKYTAADTTGDYEVVENIDINILVSCSKEIISPSITISDKVYDGSSSILEDSINISNLDSIDYTIEDISTDGVNVGEYNALFKVKLSDDYFNDYVFDNGLQEKEFNVKFNIVKADINLTDNTKDVSVKYDGDVHNINLDIDCDLEYIIKYMDSDNKYILDDVPKYSDVGEYTIKYMVMIDDNYNKYYGEKKLKIENNFSYKINNYEVDETNKYISKVIVNTDIDSFTSNIEKGTDYNIIVSYKEVNGKKILYTGSKTQIFFKDNLYSEYTNVVIGDINGDGLINSTDLLRVRQHLLGKKVLDGVYFLSSDINYDNKIDSLDLLRVRQHLLGTKVIK